MCTPGFQQKTTVSSTKEIVVFLTIDNIVSNNRKQGFKLQALLFPTIGNRISNNRQQASAIDNRVSNYRQQGF